MWGFSLLVKGKKQIFDLKVILWWDEIKKGIDDDYGKGYNWSLAQWYASTEFCTMWIDFYICSVITNLIWIPWTRIALSALLYWTWRPPSSYFSFFSILKQTLVFQKSMWNIYGTSFPLEEGSARNTWKSKANKYWNMRKESTVWKKVPNRLHSSC